MGLTDAARAGTLLFLGVLQFGILLVVAEALSPSFSVSSNYVSDLGKVFPSSAPVFNSSIALMGCLVIGSAYFLLKAFRSRLLAVVPALAGVGLIGVGAFPEGSPYALHDVFSVVAFLFIGLAAIVARRFQRPPLSYFSVILGAATLVTMVAYVPTSPAGSVGNSLGIGVGGLEQMIIYPVLLWSLAFAGHLMGSEGGDGAAKSGS